MKTCTKCGIEKARTEFYKDASKSSGIKPQCKACQKEPDRVYRAANREKNNAYQRDRYRDYPEQQLAYDRTYREANREKIRARGLVYCADKREQLRDYQRANRAANPEQHRARRIKLAKANPGRNSARSARRRAAKLRGKREDDPRIAQLYKIAACMRQQGHDVHVDHIIPLQPADPNVVPGTHTYDNLQIISAEANMRKGNRVS